jgi:ribosomal protein L11 methylase PrmA
MLKGGGFAILSGILHNQERDLRRGFRGLPLRLLDIRRQGKWITLLTQKPI